VARAAPFQFTVEVLTKLAPLTVSVRADPGRRPGWAHAAKNGDQIVTVVLAVELLLPAAGSHEAGATLVVLVSVPPGVAVTTKVHSGRDGIVDGAQVADDGARAAACPLASA